MFYLNAGDDNNDV